MSGFTVYTPGTPSRAPPYSRNYPGMLLVFSKSTRRAEHGHIGETSQRVENLELGHFEVENFGPKMTLFRL